MNNKNWLYAQKGYIELYYETVKFIIKKLSL